jgi:hypothetical protein
MKRRIALMCIGLGAVVGLLGCGETEETLGPAEPAIANSAMNVSNTGTGPEPVTVLLIAGAMTRVGSVGCWIEGGSLYVRYSVEGGWYLRATDLAVAASLSGIPIHPSGKPALRRFPLRASHLPRVAEYTYLLNLTQFGLSQAATITFAAHAEVVRINTAGWVVGKKDAWGQGQRFPRDTRGRHPDAAANVTANETDDATADLIGRRATYFVLDTLQLKGLILWNRLGSAVEITGSAYGPDGVITGVLDYLPCAYGNGFKAHPRAGDHNIPDNFVDFGGLGLQQRGCLEFWYRANWNDPSVGHVVDQLQYGSPGKGTIYNLAMQFNDWQDLLNIAWEDDPLLGTVWVQVSCQPSGIPEWSTTQPMHFAIVWDGTQPVVTQRLRVFINGQDVATLGATYYYGRRPTHGQPSRRRRAAVGQPSQPR